MGAGGAGGASAPGTFAEAREKQRLAALAKANEKRQRLKEMRADLRKGVIDAFDLIAGEIPEAEPLIGDWHVDQLLRAVPGIGKVRAHEVMTVFQVSPATKVRALSPERRRNLAQLTREAREITLPEIP
jgi:formamidopyrimidine-DNA glycosylase